MIDFEDVRADFRRGQSSWSDRAKRLLDKHIVPGLTDEERGLLLADVKACRLRASDEVGGHLLDRLISELEESLSITSPKLRGGEKTGTIVSKDGSRKHGSLTKDVGRHHSSIPADEREQALAALEQLIALDGIPSEFRKQAAQIRDSLVEAPTLASQSTKVDKKTSVNPGTARVQFDAIRGKFKEDARGAIEKMKPLLPALLSKPPNTGPKSGLELSRKDLEDARKLTSDVNDILLAANAAFQVRDPQTRQSVMCYLMVNVQGKYWYYRLVPLEEGRRTLYSLGDLEAEEALPIVERAPRHSQSRKQK